MPHGYTAHYFPERAAVPDTEALQSQLRSDSEGKALLGTVVKRPELSLLSVDKRAIYSDLYMQQTGLYDGRKTFLELPITEVVDLGFDVDIDEYCFSLEDAALNALLKEAGVINQADSSDGVAINIGTPRSRGELFISGVLQLQHGYSLVNRTGKLVRDIVDESWPRTHRIAPGIDNPAIMRQHSTRSLIGEWESKENLARNAVSALFEVFQTGFAAELAQKTKKMETV